MPRTRSMPAGTPLELSLVGQDRPGIVREVSAALSRFKVNIEDLETGFEDAASFGGRLFRAKARLLVPAGVSAAEVQDVLEGISGEIMVDLKVAARPRPRRRFPAPAKTGITPDMIRRLFILWLALVAAPLLAQSFSEQPHTRVELIAESHKPEAGKPLSVGIQLTPRDGWHTYWSNPGDAGAATRAAWTLPPGTPEPAPLAYPVPETLIVSGLMNYVYAHPNTLLTTVVPPADLKKGTPFDISGEGRLAGLQP